jgi:hypothetical protein
MYSGNDMRRNTIIRLRYVVLPLLLTLSLGAAACTYNYSVAHESMCADGLDGDGDGLTDCDDSDCAADPACAETGNCDDGLDNDDDGQVDCNDSDCATDPACFHEDFCDDGIDNDEDGFPDCYDNDCIDDPACTGGVCNHDGVCTGAEGCLWCEDCCPPCDPYEGDNTDFIVTQMVVPTVAASDTEIGVDLDGDGVIDNNFGRILGGLKQGTGDDLNQDMARDILSGEYILLTRMVVSAWPDDDQILVQTLKGLTDPTMDATEDNFSGDGNAAIDMVVDRSLHTCGSLNDGYVTAGPGTLELPITLLGGSAYLTLHGARVESTGPVTPQGFQDLMVGGGIDQATIDNQLIPYVALFLNEEIIGDPTGQWAWVFLSTVDASCDHTLYGCENVVAGTGECSPWDNDPTNPPITPTELRCHALFSDGLKPDIDLDNDGVADVLSLGYKLSGMHINIVN